MEDYEGKYIMDRQYWHCT